MMTRNLNIDFIKIVAMLCVVMLHTSHSFMNESGWDLASIMYKTGVISIPLFFMSSGYLLLGRGDITYYYCIKKILRIVRYMLIFCIGYWFCWSIVNGCVFSFHKLLNILLQPLNVTGPFYVFWYFWALIPIYLLLPILNYIFIHKGKTFIGLTIALFIVQSIFFYVNLLLGYEIVPAVGRIYNWLTFFVLGGILKKNRLAEYCNWYLSLCLWGICVIFQIFMVPHIGTTYCSIFYSSVPVILLVITFFGSSLSSHFSLSNKLLSVFSKLFLLVFTLHPFFIPLVNHFVKEIPYIGALLSWIGVAGLAIITSLGIQKIPYVSEILRI